MQKPQHKVTVSRSVTEATEGIFNILAINGKKSIFGDPTGSRTRL